MDYHRGQPLEIVIIEFNKNDIVVSHGKVKGEKDDYLSGSREYVKKVKWGVPIQNEILNIVILPIGRNKGYLWIDNLAEICKTGYFSTIIIHSYRDFNQSHLEIALDTACDIIDERARLLKSSKPREFFTEYFPNYKKDGDAKFTIYAIIWFLGYVVGGTLGLIISGTLELTFGSFFDILGWGFWLGGMSISTIAALGLHIKCKAFNDREKSEYEEKIKITENLSTLVRYGEKRVFYSKDDELLDILETSKDPNRELKIPRPSPLLYRAIKETLRRSDLGMNSRLVDLYREKVRVKANFIISCNF